MSFRGIGAALLTALLALNAPFAHAAGELQEIVKRGTLRIGFVNSPPNSSKDPRTGEVSGTYIDGMKVIVGEMGLKPEWVETTWTSFAAGLQSGQFDICIAGTFATIKRSMAVDFTKPIFYAGYSGVVRSDDTRFKEVQDMNRPDIKIAVIQGGANEEFVRRVLPKAQIVALSTGNLAATFIEVASGRADAAFEDANSVAAFTAQQPGVKNLFEGRPFNLQAVVWTVRKGNAELLSVINAGIDSMLVSGRWAEVARPYASKGRFIEKPNYVPLVQ